MSNPASSAPSAKPRRPALVIAACVAVIAASAAFLWWQQQDRSARQQEELHRMIGKVMAEETTRVLGGRGKILLISIDTKAVPELKWQLEAFHENLPAAGGITISKTYDLETEGKTKYTYGSGLSARRYVRNVNKNPGIDAVVSFAGAPNFKEGEEKELQFKPKLIAESRSSSKLKKLFEGKYIDVAVVSRFEFPNPIQGSPRNPRELFIQRFQVVTPAEAGRLPADSDE
ncbi:MAG: hypothetical protein RJA22_2825 [Verrucomicrobiota bacterium]|jgi:hypothetical protein